MQSAGNFSATNTTHCISLDINIKFTFINLTETLHSVTASHYVIMHLILALKLQSCATYVSFKYLEMCALFRSSLEVEDNEVKFLQNRLTDSVSDSCEIWVILCIWEKWLLEAINNFFFSYSKKNYSMCWNIKMQVNSCRILCKVELYVQQLW